MVSKTDNIIISNDGFLRAIKKCENYIKFATKHFSKLILNFSENQRSIFALLNFLPHTKITIIRLRK